MMTFHYFLSILGIIIILHDWQLLLDLHVHAWTLHDLFDTL